MASRRSSDNIPDTKEQKRVFGRKLGRPLNASRKRVIEELLPKLTIPADILKEDGSLAPSSLFQRNYNECWLEIGFGTGEHLSGLMRRDPDNVYIGAEPFINGMAAFLKDIAEAPLHNIRVHMDDAMMVAHSLADESIDGIYILNPDPWHKKRHHKRRIVQRKNLEHFARILRPGGQLILSTDVPYLADWMITETCLNGQFKWQAKSKTDWANEPEGWIKTAYQTKGAKGADKMVFLLFKKKA